MAPSRKSKSVYKRSTNDINVGSSSKSKQRKKNLADKLGHQWTKGELERFYDAYRKHVGDWEKVAAAVRGNRSAEMVETLFLVNRAYLSLPDGTASVAGLIAMMTDHYGVIEGSESEGEDYDASGVPRKHQKHKRIKIPPCDFHEATNSSHSMASAEGCLSILKQTKAYERRRLATRKRTTRLDVPNERDDREDSTPNKRANKLLDADDDASRRGGVSPLRRTELSDSTPIGLEKKLQAQEAQFKQHDGSMFENGVRTGRHKKHKKEAVDRDDTLLMDMKELVPHKKKDVRVEEAKGCKFDGDELEALNALAGMAASLTSAGLMESESSPQCEERLATKMDEKSNTLENGSISHHIEKANEAGPEDSLLHETSAAHKRQPEFAQASIDGNAVSTKELGTPRRKRKLKMLDVEVSKESTQKKSQNDKVSAEDNNLKTLVKVRRSGQGPAKQLKTAKTSEDSSSSSDKKRTGLDAEVSVTQLSGSGQATLPQKPNRRKMSLKRSLQERAKSSKTTHDNPRSPNISPEHELLKEEVSTCLSNPLVRRWCIFEWFYSAIDYPWFAKMELIDYLSHVGLGHVTKLTRLEWSVIKSSLGRARRFSESFIQEERDKLHQYREFVRKHYTDLRECTTQVLHTDLARPLSVGNRVIAIHPKTREIRDGKILTVDHNKCNVLFDGLGVELVMDIDCMPLNPLEYMPEGLRKQFENCLSISKEARLNRHSDASVLGSPVVLENVSFSMNPPVKQEDIKEPVTHNKVLATNTADQSIATSSKARGAEIQQPLTLLHTSDMQEMEPEMIEIVNGSKSMAQAMVDAAIKAASSGNMAQQTSGSIDNSIGPSLKHQEHANGNLDHHTSKTAESMKMEMPSELITSCLATCLMIQMCSGKQYPPSDVAQLIDRAVSELEPRCPQNMPIYRDIQKCMGWIKTQIMSLVRT